MTTICAATSPDAALAQQQPAQQKAPQTTAAALSAPGAWVAAMRQQVERIERDTPGQLGVYVKRLDTGEVFAHQADRPWYLASSAKLPIAIAVLREVEQGRLRMDQEVVVQEGDKVDGSGGVVWQDNGTRHDVKDLLRRMLMESDNTAANMLMRTAGQDGIAQRARALLGAGAGRITDFAEVRYGVYTEFSPDARKLSHTDLVRIAGAPMGPRRVQALARALDVPQKSLQVQTMEEAYARFYRRGDNTASLVAYGGLLENLVRGKLLNAEHQQLLYKDLKFDTYDAYRLEAGLPRTVRFIHKTGTQFQRACHMGVIDPQDGGQRAIIVATCAEGLDEQKQAGRAFESLGRAITQTALKARG
ncbi:MULTISPECIES: serine hydrolase [unclassified Acidovorax]|uniref:serine hydrolase n=1 Tax=unclassified Acidovorax TaxID=2684926 RepID=UPI002883356F|nr:MULTISPECIES: serine hydrolase [unclassified Acidovorax]